MHLEKIKHCYSFFIRNQNVCCSQIIIFPIRLADKSRFAYDGLKRQRLVTPMLRDNTGELKPVDWEVALLTVAKVVKNAGKNTTALIS